MPSWRAEWKTHWAIISVLSAYVLLGLIYSVVTPIFEASDELWHYPFVKHIADGHGLPIQDPTAQQLWRQEGSQPPLYYAVAALATFWIDTSDLSEILWRNPHADIGIPTPDGNINMIVHTDRERFPYQGTVLAVHIIRALSVFVGLVTVWCTYRICVEVFPEREPLAVGAAAFTAFNPMFLFISGSVNNDTLATALCAVAVWMMVRLVSQRWAGCGHLALLGLVIGLAALSKLSGLGLLPLAMLALILVSWQRKEWSFLVRGCAIVFSCVTVVAGWWYIRNWLLYGDFTGLNVFVTIAGPRHPTPTLLQLWGERWGFIMSFWGFFGGVNVPMAHWIYQLLTAIAEIGVLSCVLALVWAWLQRRFHTERWLKITLLMAWPIILFASFVRWTLMTIASQGRHLFPALPCIAFIVALGLWHLSPPRVRPWSMAALAALMFAIAIVAPFIYIAPAYARPALLSPTETAAILNPLHVSFNDEITLLGYELSADAVGPGDWLEVTLYWQAQKEMERNYSVFVHLLAPGDLILGQRDTYPGLGKFPTTLWKPGDTIRDTYALKVSPVALATEAAQVEVGLYTVETGQRLPAYIEGKPVGDHVRFGEITIAVSPQEGIPNPVYINFDNCIALVGYDLDRQVARPGETFHLTLFWKCLRPVRDNYSVFTHVLGPNNSIWAQMDSWPQGGNAPTSTWVPGQVIEDHYELRLNDQTPAGVYEIEIGFYLGEKRLSVLGEGGQVVDDRAFLSKVRVLPAES
ncbi:MAG: glycosyltransferase family 39 protein [Chloroflexi bacterium]|nr:glycosyltransferase family 39 protein [Chloroflexota bacterium]